MEKYYKNLREMSKYRECKNGTGRERSSTAETNLKKKRNLFSRKKRVDSSPSEFQNYLLLGNLGSTNNAQVETIFTLIKVGNADGLRLFLNDKPEFIRLRDQLHGAGLVHFAAEHDQTAVIDTLIEFGLDVNVTDGDGNTPFHWTAIHSSLTSMVALLGYDADYAKLNNESESALHIAISENRLEFVKAMLDSGFDINVVIHGPKGKTPLHYAAEFNNLEIVQEIYRYGLSKKVCSKEPQFRLCARDDANNTPTHAAARAGSAKVLEFMFNGSKNHGYTNEDILNFVSVEHSTPLHNAVDGGHTEVIKLLIKFGADPFCTQEQLLPPFHIAASMSDPSCVEAMLEVMDMSKLDFQDQEGSTGLVRAIVSHNYTVAHILLKAGANPNTKSRVYKDSALHLAIRLNAEGSFVKLLEFGADIFSVNIDGDTILHLALRLPNVSIVEKILLHEDLHKLACIENNEHLKPIQLAVRHNKLSALKHLVEQFKSTTIEKCKLETYCDLDLLHIAAEEGHHELAQYLIEDSYKKGKSIINHSNESGITPLHLAAMNGHIQVVQLLLKYGAILHRCPSGNTPFSEAAKSGYLKIIQIFLEAFPHAKNWSNQMGNTPLHIAAYKGHTEIVIYLLNKDAKITLNEIGTTFFYEAIIHDRFIVVSATLKHKRWQEALDVLATSKPPPFAALIIRMPSLAKLVLEKSIEKSSFSDIKKRNWIRYNFKYLFPPPNLPVLSRAASIGHGGSSVSDNSQSVDESKSISFSISSTLRAAEDIFEYEKVDQMYILEVMRKYVRKDLLSHPLVNKFLQAKWQRYGSSFYAMSLFTFFVYIILLSVFSLVYPPLYNCSADSWWDLNFTGNANGSYIHDRSFYAYRLILDVISLLYLFLLFVGLFLAKHKLSYIISIHSLIEILCYISTLIFLPLHTPCPIPAAGAFALYFGWVTFMFYLGNYGIFALYTRMLIAVLKTVVFMLPLVLILILSFAFAFYMLLSPVLIEHTSIERSLLYVFQMLIGEPGIVIVTDFAFANDEGLPSKGVVYFFLLLSGVLITIILTNLLIGLAVGDIANVREGAYLQRVKDRIIFFGNMDRAIPDWIRRDAKHAKLIEYPSRHRFGKLSVIWNHIFDLVAPYNNEKIDDFASDEQNFDTYVQEYKNKLDDLKTMVTLQLDMITSLKNEISARSQQDFSRDEDVYSKNIKPAIKTLP